MNRQMRRHGGGGGGMGGFGPDLLRQAQELQNQLVKAQAEFEAATVEATAGGGAVRVVLTGANKVKEIAIAPEVVDPDDVEMLQDLVMAAVNDAARRVEDEMKASVGGMLGGMNIPGL